MGVRRVRFGLMRRRARLQRVTLYSTIYIFDKAHLAADRLLLNESKPLFGLVKLTA